jgi:hypothetical protein
MAMNKAEKKELEDLKTKLALRFFPKIEPDIKPPQEDYKKIVNGYSFNSYSKRVEKACTSKHYHSIGQWDETRCRDSVCLYSTEKLAYQAMLHELSSRFAFELREVEKRMEAK